MVRIVTWCARDQSRMAETPTAARCEAREPGMRRVRRQQKKMQKLKQRRVCMIKFKGMTNSVKEAIEVLQQLPENEQDTVVRAIMDFAGRDDRTHSDE